MIKKIAVLVLCSFFVLPACTQKMINSNEVNTSYVKEGKLHHIVLFNFKEDAPVDKIESAMYKLFGSIDEVHDLSFNRNVSSRNLDKGYKYSFYMTLDSEFARDSIFYTHPNYKEIGGIIGQYINEYLIYDYWIPEVKRF